MINLQQARITLLSIFAAIVTAALLSACATTNLPGPPGECLRNADVVGRKEGDSLLRTGNPTDVAVTRASGVRNAARVGCAVVGVMVVHADEKIEQGVPVSRATDIANSRLEELLVAGFLRNMRSNPASLAGHNPEELAAKLGEQAASFARPYIPRSATEFRNYARGWRQVITSVEDDHNVPGGKAVIALARQEMNSFWPK